ncbi:kelch-like protein 38 [Lineus longissimus]|uniref:kelch-like protein 38 n=1 Tax=Lineus longissimus TaxID=88925 RepID=UPI002B4E257E
MSELPNENDLPNGTHNVNVDMESDEFRDFMNPDELSDVILVVEKKKLYVHRQYLAEWSSVWRTMFLTNFANRNQTEIMLPGKRLEDILDLLRCIYPMQSAVTDENVNTLLSLADEYMMERIMTKCEDFLLEKDPTMETLVTAQRYNLKRLFKSCVDYAKNCCLEDVEKCPEFTDLEPHTILMIYKSKLDSLREYAYAMQGKEKNTRSEHEALKLQHEKTLLYTRTIEGLWESPSKRCYRHITNDKFDFSCTECNEKVQRQVRRLCSETIGMRKVYLNHSNCNSVVSTPRDRKI